MNKLLARALAVAFVTTLAADASATPAPMTRDDILKLAKEVVGYSYWWGHGAYRSDGASPGTCTPTSGGGCPSCTHSGSYGADCSGFVGKAWQVPSPIAITTDAHPYSTWSFAGSSSDWSPISRTDARTMDAFVYNNGSEGHIFLYESGDPWGNVWADECKGCVYGCVHDLRTTGSAYVARRRASIITGPPPPPPPPPGAKYAAKFVSQSYPMSFDGPVIVPLGGSVDGYIDMQNIGTAAWSPKATYLAIVPRTETSSPFGGPAWAKANRPSAVDKETAPGATGRFALKLYGKTIGDSYVGFALVEEGVSWFADAPIGGGPPDDFLKVHVVVVDPDAGVGDAGPILADADDHDPGDTWLPDAAATNADAGGGSSSGCGCRLGGDDRSTSSTVFSAAIVALLAIVVRRRSRVAA